MASALTVIAVGNPASASPSKCFEADNDIWDSMRAMADQFANDGTISQATADAYKCDPRTVNKNLSVRVEKMGAGEVSILAWGDTGGIIVHIGTPEVFWFRQRLQWEYDYNIVSNWSGECTGGTTAWGSANFWTFAGCTTNDFIPYLLNGHMPGGIHHRTIGLFTNSIPWTFNYEQLVSTWGHYDGTADYKVY